MDASPLIQIIDNRPSVCLFLTAIVKSVGEGERLSTVTSLGSARELLKRGPVKMVVMGLENYDIGRKVAFLQHLSSASPQTIVVLVYDSEHSVKTPNGKWITSAWPNLAYFSTILDTMKCRALFTRVLNSTETASKIERS